MESLSAKKHISVSETAHILGISETSVRNWVRHGFIKTSSNNAGLSFLKDDVLSLRSRILSGDLNRLTSRANKFGSSKIFFSKELFHSVEERRAVLEILDFVMRHNLSFTSALFFVSLILLNKNNMLGGTQPKNIVCSKDINIKNRKNLSKILSEWRDSIISEIRPEFFEILNIYIPERSNIAGIIYQSVLMEGTKCKMGMYYTPDSIVSEITKRAASPSSKFLDPCCGSGQFLLALADTIKNPENIYGIDIDAIAVNIAKINLIMKFPDIDFYPKVFCADFLFDIDQVFLRDKLKVTEFDCIATNPPWGSHFSNSDLKIFKSCYPEISSGESFSFFLVKSLNLLKEDGILSFVLPESVLNVKLHSDIRKYIYNRYGISRIEQKKKVFRNIYSSTVIIDIENSKKNDSVKIVNSQGTKSIGYAKLGCNRDFHFNININSEDEKILSKIYSLNYRTLKDNAVWALGIVTGNNNYYIKSTKLKGYEPVIRGIDITPYKISASGSFIKFEPKRFQQTADVSIYRKSEKLIYRYISNRLIFACDKEGRLTLNSANILIPQFEDIDIKVVMALFNSELYQFIFQKKFSSIKVLRSHLEELPIPDLSKSVHDYILYLVKNIEAGESTDKLDEYIYKIFMLSKSETDYIKKNIE
ncbi:MAG: N-6 DNA methylase [Spirochaetes bacterium]|nr:N-6 DNA methylase [Spirochaetota bacterium]